LSLTAQKKSVSFEQAFKNAPFDIIKQLPVSDKWVDDEHYTEHRQDENGHWNWWLVEAKTGKAVIDPHPPQEETMIAPRAEPPAAGDKRNGTTSPDGKWLAYTKKDNNLYVENRNKLPQEELDPFVGKHVAFSMDGTRILASGDDSIEVERKLVAAGFDPSQVIFSHIDPPDLVVL